MDKKITQVWKTPDGRYFDTKEDAQIVAHTEEVKEKLKELARPLVPVYETLCQYAPEVIDILNEYVSSIKNIGKNDVKEL